MILILNIWSADKQTMSKIRLSFLSCDSHVIRARCITMNGILVRGITREKRELHREANPISDELSKQRHLFVVYVCVCSLSYIFKGM